MVPKVLVPIAIPRRTRTRVPCACPGLSLYGMVVLCSAVLLLLAPFCISPEACWLKAARTWTVHWRRRTWRRSWVDGGCMGCMGCTVLRSLALTVLGSRIWESAMSSTSCNWTAPSVTLSRCVPGVPFWWIQLLRLNACLRSTFSPTSAGPHLLSGSRRTKNAESHRRTSSPV